MTANELLLNASVSHAVQLERYKTAEVEEIAKILQAADGETRMLLLKRGDIKNWTTARLSKLLSEIGAINSETQQEIERRIKGDMLDFSDVETSRQSAAISKALDGINFEVVQPAPAQVWAAAMERPFDGILLKNALEGIETGRQRRIDQTIRRDYVMGKTTDEIVRELYGTRAARYRDGIMPAYTRKDVANIVRTAVAQVASAAREKLFEENEDIIRGVQVVGTLDSHTCEICAAYDGMVFDLGVGVGVRIPLHFSCRCTTIPVLKSWKEMGSKVDVSDMPPGTRASVNGQVPATLDYGQWLSRQPTSLQREILGPGRYELFRKGVPVTAFVSDGKALTLEQIRAEVGDIPEIKRDVFKPGETTREVEAWARAHDVAETVDFGKLPVSVANEMTKAIWDAYEKFPELREKMSIFGSNQAIRKWYIEQRGNELVQKIRSLPQGDSYTDVAVIAEAKRMAALEFGKTPKGVWALAYDSPSKGLRGITVNEIAMRNPEKFGELLRSNIESKFHPVGCDTVKSVIDHEVGHRIDAMMNWFSSGDTLLRAAGIDELSRREAYDYIYENLSGYALRSRRELFAEAWAEYCNNPSPREMSQKIGDWAIKRYEDWRVKR